MIEIVFDGIGSLGNDNCACCICAPKTGTGGDYLAKVESGVPLFY